MNALPASLAAIAIDPPNLPIGVVREAVRDQYGVDGDFLPLISERDQNFQLTAANGERYVVKIVSSADETLQHEFQIAALRHLEQQNVAGVPRVIATVSGKLMGRVDATAGESLALRLVSWVDGGQRQGPLNPTAAASLGKIAARLGQAFEGFSHPGENQELLWDIRRAAELQAMTHYIDDAQIRQSVECALREFEDRTSNTLRGMRRQVIHNDLNGGNLIHRGDRVCGVIDFGDMLAAPRIQELGVAAAYLRDLAKPSRLIGPLVRAYNNATTLSAEERGVLFDLVRARLCTTTVILHWRLAARSAEDPYRQKALAEESSAADFLAVLNAMGPRRFEREIFDD